MENEATFDSLSLDSTKQTAKCVHVDGANQFELMDDSE